MTFTILSVCTGNVCRSPIAEMALADALSPIAEVSVESAGVAALVGAGVPEPARRIAAEEDIDASHHVARQIDSALIRGADLVLAMARDHRRAIVETVPAAMRRSFTLRELARVADGIEAQLPEALANSGATTPEEGMRAAVALAASLRGTVPPPADPQMFDIIDPYRQSDEVYRRSFAELLPAAERVAAFLTTAARLASR
ncbi:low molecular weight phosphatase family protein [Microbacterium enclense]|uniref:arsenate reductase/protein-tyrosine-phosphatase family protein n=1 Tax=Microbacterium enclense TaxID=993073 RepID=UPI0013E2ED19|nr:low molecular weight phosphatase family protein [Microbacterium enclense]